MKKSTQASGAPTRLQQIDDREALVIAMRLHQHGQLDAAQELYEQLLVLDPRNANARHYLGVLMHARERSEEAVKLIHESIALDPNVPDWHGNLGNVLLNLGRVEDAADAYAKAVDLAPHSAGFLNNLGAVRRAQGRLPEAKSAFLKALELDPTRADAYNNLGNLYHAMGLAEQSLKYYCEALIRDPTLSQSRKMLGIAYYKLGRFDEAAKVYRDWMVDEPENPLPRHYLAAHTGEAVPDRAEDGYVEATFDEFAESFDAKLERLAYRAPQLVADIVARIHGELGRQIEIVDAGCGTGLCGPMVAPYARRLVGLDLSAHMLAKARLRNVYDELHKGELTAFLQGLTQACDLVISADTMCYFGKLEPVCNAAHGALRPQGWLVFTVESLLDAESKEPFRLNPHGRYSHNRDYVEAVLRTAGFVRIAADSVHLRNEDGLPVYGWLVSVQRI